MSCRNQCNYINFWILFKNLKCILRKKGIKNQFSSNLYTLFEILFILIPGWEKYEIHRPEVSLRRCWNAVALVVTRRRKYCCISYFATTVDLCTVYKTLIQAFYDLCKPKSSRNRVSVALFDLSINKFMEPQVRWERVQNDMTTTRFS